ncbi:enoyl-CoA hydratase-related protein [Mechercharimyces sp. CAU 1602]|uniref:enoyl-CoA hydratase-related protein n=1 Tax=Mechercharimyces sp. CAU 1602 TaxID=2973933 RepID=UPI002162B85B|nr:enoyl-CoA hydratase-related protein [Mechercharimyces sp. CAU 1602]MCS1351910.1 enoyl-CoA hydratase-related protein [Mechercharimyces sp. CAU 1602]
MAYQHILVTKIKGVGRIQLDRPDVLNALNLALMDELVHALNEMERDDEVGCILLCGNEHAFAAGADIFEMLDATTTDLLVQDQFSAWDRLSEVKKPMIAAVSGMALGGGCELAMACDLILAAEGSSFGQPEINLGVMPGAGGTQRLVRSVGKAKAMEMVLLGRPITAQEAYRLGLINEVVPAHQLEEEAMKWAQRLANKAPLAVRLAKESILKSMESTLAEGLDFEQKCFYLLFATEDQKEGMRAFVEKRRPHFHGK